MSSEQSNNRTFCNELINMIKAPRPQIGGREKLQTVWSRRSHCGCWLLSFWVRPGWQACWRNGRGSTSVPPTQTRVSADTAVSPRLLTSVLPFSIGIPRSTPKYIHTINTNILCYNFLSIPNSSANSGRRCANIKLEVKITFEHKDTVTWFQQLPSHFQPCTTWHWGHCMTLADWQTTEIQNGDQKTGRRTNLMASDGAI